MQKIDDFTAAIADLEKTNQDVIIEALTANADGIRKGMPITNIDEVTEILKNLLEKEYTVQYDAPKNEINIGAGDPKNPIAVRLSDGTKFYDMLKQVVSAQRMPFTNPSTGTQTPITLTTDGALPTSRGLVPFKFDQIVPTWDANNNPTSVVYKQGGQTVCTLTITWDANNNPTNVIRS
jgi:hypothetical protein